MSIRNAIIANWSTEPSKYYEEESRFIEQHRGADGLVFDLENNLVRAVYEFAPYRSYVEKLQLQEKIAEMTEEEKTKDGE